MSQNTVTEHPRFGFTEQRLVTLSTTALTETSLVGVSVARKQGMRLAITVGVFVETGGAGEINFLIEGSNDNINFFPISELLASDFFGASGTKVLNSAGSGLVDLERWAWVRVRAIIESGNQTFVLGVIVTGIARDSDKFMRQTDFVRAGVVPTSQDGQTFVRPAGTLLSNIQVVATGVVLGGVTSFDVTLQGSPDGGTTWIDIGTTSFTGDAAQLISVGGERLISYGAFARFRFRVVDVGGAPDATTAFAISCLSSLDSSDWTSDEDESSGGGGGADAAIVEAVWGAPGAEGADTIVIALQLLDGEGAPLQEARKIEVIVYDTADAGDLDLSTDATFTAVGGGGAVIAGLATNRVMLTTAANGTATVSVLDALIESVFLSVVNPRANQDVNQIITKAEEATLTFA